MKTIIFAHVVTIIEPVCSQLKCLPDQGGNHLLPYPPAQQKAVSVVGNLCESGYRCVLHGSNLVCWVLLQY